MSDIIYCKDCRYCGKRKNRKGEEYVYCRRLRFRLIPEHALIVYPHDFCSWAVKKNGD